MIDPRAVYCAVPCADGRMMAELTGSLLRVGNRFAAFSTECECSHVSLVRNIIAEKFLRSPMEWLVSIDSDICFTPDDWNFLMEECDPQPGLDQPTPSRTTIAGIDGRDSKGAFLYTQRAADLLVCAEYSFKNEEMGPVKLGMGFVRIHRSVFETLSELKHEDGTSRCWQTMREGRLITDFYPSGPLLSQLIPTADWKGEDHGFWTLCMLAGLIPRIEKRTRLTHIGRKAYGYDPDHGGAQ
jgi:hypothetical protein